MKENDYINHSRSKFLSGNFHLFIYAMLIIMIVGCNRKMVIAKKSSIKFIKEHALSWQNDSLGILAQRDEIYKLLDKNSFKGIRWEKVEKYFGKANIEKMSDEKDSRADNLKLYIYYCSIQDEYISNHSRKSSQILIGVNPITERIVYVRMITYIVNAM